jgi:hypothetical protein
MSSTAHAHVLTEDPHQNEILSESRPAKPIRESLALVEQLKEEFGDYSDPLTYDWTWRETD